MCTLARMPVLMLAGIPVPPDLVQQLARLLRYDGFDDTAAKLEHAIANETRVLALSIPDREAILRTLGDGPAGLAELRATLLLEHEWRIREGLV
jgi:hypothetical protein